MNQINRLFLSVLPLFLLSVAGFARETDTPPAGFRETAEVREALFDDWLSTGISPLLSLASEEVTDRYGHVFTVGRERDEETGLLAVHIQSADATGIQDREALARAAIGA